MYVWYVCCVCMSVRYVMRVCANARRVCMHFAIYMLCVYVWFVCMHLMFFMSAFMYVSCVCYLCMYARYPYVWHVCTYV